MTQTNWHMSAISLIGYCNFMTVQIQIRWNPWPFINSILTPCRVSYCIPHISLHKNIERHTEDTIVSWPNPTQWVIVHTSDLMMMIRQSIYILSFITREMGKLKTYSPTYCICQPLDHGLICGILCDKWWWLTHQYTSIYMIYAFVMHSSLYEGISTMHKTVIFWQ